MRGFSPPSTESSVEAFRLTLRALSGNITRTLDAIASFERSGGSQTVSDFLADVSLDDEDDDLDGADEFTVGKKVQISLSDMDVPSWKHDLEADLFLIRELTTSMELVGPDDDAKLQHLKGIIAGKLAEPLNPRNRKVIIFTAFADTANYLYATIWRRPSCNPTAFIRARSPAPTHPRSTLKKSYDFQSVLTLFSPRSKEKASDPARGAGRNRHSHRYRLHLGRPEPSGLRLPGQLRHPLESRAHHPALWPYRPHRLAERQIQLVNYWPDISLDEYISLKERVENRMVIADVTATGDDNVLDRQEQRHCLPQGTTSAPSGGSHRAGRSARPAFRLPTLA